MKIRPVGVQLFYEEERTDGRTDGRTDKRTDGQTNITKLIVAFRNFVNTPKSDKNHLLFNIISHLMYASTEPKTPFIVPLSASMSRPFSHICVPVKLINL